MTVPPPGHPAAHQYDFSLDQLITGQTLIALGIRDWIERAEAGAFKTTRDNIHQHHRRLAIVEATIAVLKKDTGHGY